MSSQLEAENIKKDLFNNAMKGRWDEVVDVYMENPTIHAAKITKSGDTTLHVAVSDGQEAVVAKMVDIVRRQQADRIVALGVQNERKNTALHFAASMGNVKICQLIAGADPSLVGIRNLDGETPLFLAALHGRKDAFLCLHCLCTPNTDTLNYSYCGRNDGDTILHCAIAGDYFDLAFQIIHLYKDLVNRVNEKGFTPLHLLASKPSVFRSGSRLRRLEKIIYPFIYVEELASYDPRKFKTAAEDKSELQFPQNYGTLMDIFRVIRTAVKIVSIKLVRKKDYAEAKDNPQDQKEHESSGRSASQKVEGKNDDAEAKDDLEAQKKDESGKQSGPQVKHEAPAQAQANDFVPPNYKSCFELIKFVYLAMLVILGQGAGGLKRIRRKKEKHVWSVQLMNKLLVSGEASLYEYDDDGSKPGTDVGEETTNTDELESVGRNIDQKTDQSNTSKSLLLYSKTIIQNALCFTLNLYQGDDKNKSPEKEKIETPILIAAKNGVTEMVEKILELFPVAIHDMDAQKKNIVLLAVENRQPHVYQLLLKRKILKDSLFRKVDHEGNSALHLAAKLGANKPWLIPGAALQMQWEIKWYQFVKDSMPSQFFVRYNKRNQTPKEIFTESHKELVKDGGEWLSKTSESCSVVAALIATVAFATSTAVPGGVNEDTGFPTLENKPAFNVFAISSLVALCCSVTSVVMFLSVLTSRYQEFDFGKDLPRKLLLGLTSLFMSIASMLVAFCAGHFFVLKDKLKYATFPIYAVTSLPVTLFALAQFPLYIDLLWATFKKVPRRSYKVVAPL